MKRTLVLGLGNDILTDDAIGLRVVREVARRLAGRPGVDVHETEEMGLALLDWIVGYDALILVDAIQTGAAAPGTIKTLAGDQLPDTGARTPHFLGVGETLKLGEILGLAMPREVRVLGVEVADPFTLGTELTPALQAALPRIVDAVVREVEACQAQPVAA